MDWRFWLLSAVAAGVLAAVFYLAWRKDGTNEQQNAPPKEPKEPGFISRGRNAADSPSAENAKGVSNSNSVADKNSNKDSNKNSNEEIADADDDSIVDLQGALSMNEVQAPQVPPPPPQLFPLEICYVIRLFGKTLSASVINRLHEEMHQKRRYYLLGYDANSKRWRLNNEAACSYWMLATPLADRGGALQAADIKRIEEKARAFAQKENVDIVFSAAYESLENAGRIDRFCEKVDLCIELRLYGDNVGSGRAAEALQLAGLVADESGRYYVRRERSELLFRAKVMPAPSSGARQAIIFEMDAPNVSAPSDAFDKMLQTARRAAQILNMQISDPRGGEINDDRAAAMRRQLDILSEQMRGFGAEPGGIIASLIFS